jgi:hypothetical protein
MAASVAFLVLAQDRTGGVMAVTVTSEAESQSAA